MSQIGIDIETRLYDVPALRRRPELKFRDSDVDRVILVVAGHRESGVASHRRGGRVWRVDGAGR
jgi:hypothetical protein